MKSKLRIYDLIKTYEITQNENNLIFNCASVVLLIGKDNLSNIIDLRIQPGNMDSLCDEILERAQENSMEVVEMIRYFVDALNNEVIQPELILKIFNILIDMSETELIGIVENDYLVDHVGSNKDTDELTSLSDVEWVDKLVIELLKGHDGNTLYNPECGNGTFLMLAKDANLANDFIGSSCNERMLFISKVRSYIKDRKRITVVNEKLFGAIPRKADLIYAAYPFGAKYDIEEIQPMIDSWEDNVPITHGRKYSSNMICLINILQALTPNGIAIALIPDGGLVNSIDTEIRKYLIEYNFLDAVISLPSGIIPSNGISTSLLILNKNRKPSDGIMMIDATEYFQKERRRITFSDIDIKRIVDAYKDVPGARHYFNVDREEVIENNYYLGVSRYMEIGVSLINPCQLGSVCKDIFRGYQLKASDLDSIVTEDKDLTDYRIINVSDLQPEGFISSNMKAIKVDNPKRYDKYCVEDGDIIITAKNSIVKTAVYEQEGKIKAVLTGNLIVIRVNHKMINPYYLKTFLDSQSGKAMIKSIQTGTTVVSINPNSLKEMNISLIDMEYQTVLAESFIERVYEIKRLFERYEEIYDELEHLYDRSIRFNF